MTWQSNRYFACKRSEA